MDKLVGDREDGNEVPSFSDFRRVSSCEEIHQERLRKVQIDRVIHLVRFRAKAKPFPVNGRRDDVFPRIS